MTPPDPSLCSSSAPSLPAEPSLKAFDQRQLCRGQREDPDLGPLIPLIMARRRPGEQESKKLTKTAKSLLKHHGKLFVSGGILMKVYRPSDSDEDLETVVVPAALQPELLGLGHDQDGHQGQEGTYIRSWHGVVSGQTCGVRWISTLRLACAVLLLRSPLNRSAKPQDI